VRGTLVLGLVGGLTIGLLSLGLVLVYKAARFVNFAHGQLGVVSAMLLGRAVLAWGWSWWVAFPLAVAVGAGVGALSERLVVRPLAGRSRMTLLIATIGLSQVLLGMTYFTWLAPPRERIVFDGFPVPFDVRIRIDDSFSMLSSHVLVLVLAPLIAVGLAVLLRKTMLGKAIRAAASNPDAAGLAGVPVHKLSTITWAIAGSLSAVSAILAAPSQVTYDTQALGPALLLRALGASAMGGFTSLPVAFGAGIGLGVIEAVAFDITRDGGTSELLVFLVILAGLVVRAKAFRRSGRDDGEQVDIETRPLVVPSILADRAIVRRAPAMLLAGAVLFGLLAPMLPPWEAQSKQFLLALTLVYALVAVSVTLLAGWAGQVSLGQVAFVGVGAYIGGRLVMEGWSLPAAGLAGGSVAAVLSVVVGLPALRLRGLTLAVTTLGLAVVTPSWLLRQSWMAPEGAYTIDPPGMVGLGRFHTQRSLYYVALAALAIACLSAAALRRSSAGRLVLAVRDNERSAAALGVSPAAVKLAVFALSGFTAGFAGVLWAAVVRSLTVDQFGSHLSMTVLAVAVVGGIGSLAGGLLGSVALVGIPALTADWFRWLFDSQVQFQLFLGGAGLVVTQLLNPGGMAEAVKRAWEHFLARLAEAHRAALPHVDGAPALAVEDVRVHFGGVVALDGVSIVVQPGEVVGLIGTNGAGKTTLLDAVSGLIVPDAGSVRVSGREIGHLAPEYRAHFGVARSFQDATLFPRLTVTEAVQVALGRSARVGVVASLLGAPWVRFTDRRTRAHAARLVQALGLGPWADTLTADLSTGTRRICDLAVQIAADPRVLLLDEPTAGVAQRDAEAFGPLLRSVVDGLGCATLIVEHDMPLLLGLADRIYCLESGRVIAEGTPDEIRNNPRVVASYLGTDPTAIDRSGRAKSKKRTRRAARPLTGAAAGGT
jgi:ABC-type branched-subunit amino acid transport system ATPase component/ABC-type branched-subunit amino acid transport system permease subunit